MRVTVKEWLKSVLNYRSYPKNKTGYPVFLDHPVDVATMSWCLSSFIVIVSNVYCGYYSNACTLQLSTSIKLLQ